MQVHPKNRLGTGPDGPRELRKHAFFKNFDWDDLERKKLPAPYLPTISPDAADGIEIPEFLKFTNQSEIDTRSWDPVLWAHVA